VDPEDLFRVGTEVRLTDVDLNGHVNHAAYLAYAEAARIHHLGSTGVTPQRLVDNGLAVIVLRLEIDYRQEVALGETVSATSRYVFEPGRRSFHNQGQVLLGDQPAAELKVVLGLLDLATRKLRTEPVNQLRQLASDANNEG
jgi:YbgC/YbaW family acyl-CoA thioester hydrolase